MDWKESLNQFQMEGRCHREHSPSLTSCVQEYEPLSIDKMVELSNEINKKFAGKTFYKYGLSCGVAYQKIVDVTTMNKRPFETSPNVLGCHSSFYGIDIRPLEGLKDKMLFFKEREDMENFLRIVDNDIALLLWTPEKAVEEAIKFFEFKGKINDGTFMEETI